MSGPALEIRDGMLLVEGCAAPVPPPEGYSFSYVAEGAGAPLVVCTGDQPYDGWWDWHFAWDEDAQALRRAGPAY